MESVLQGPTGNTAELASTVEHKLLISLANLLESLLQGTSLAVCFSGHLLEDDKARC